MHPPRTSRLRLREMSMTDLDDMAALLGDSTVMEFYPAPKDRAEAAAWIAWNMRNYAEHGFGLWIAETHEGEFIGDCGLTWQTVNGTPHLEVGYHVRTDAQCQGFATEAARACLDHARDRGVAQHLVAVIHQANRASQRVAAKLGMQRNPALRHASPIHEVFSLDLSSPSAPPQSSPQTDITRQVR
ncbi:Protein N-acetyltransferase, RimJ/RimL family [Brevibacterium siliguriense]|uniref:Protein N-acetyltransferase, RimJ/RimL family n=1 Tax=Brevibacterium siliguriense TaxID=1136497 RepID=A0A1H1MXV0_9MICO|nr:GNAT family N-acetyltransferase [Brevibacterium siliguriense]SDR91428.1 Protein N-acetyltransferase, RimJ/RimL family [Brevibacterium siliguriense]